MLLLPTLQLITTSIKHIYYGNITFVRIIANDIARYASLSLEQRQRAPSLVSLLSTRLIARVNQRENSPSSNSSTDLQCSKEERQATGYTAYVIVPQYHTKTPLCLLYCPDMIPLVSIILCVPILCGAPTSHRGLDGRWQVTVHTTRYRAQASTYLSCETHRC